MSRPVSAELRRIQCTNALAAFGNGLTMPFLFVYAAQVRELGDGTAGAVLALFAAAALVVLPFAGRVIDHRGPVPAAFFGSFLAAVGALGFGLSGSAVPVLASSGLMGAGVAVLQPTLATMIVRCSSSATRARAFATQFFLNNLGLGIGGLLGGLVVDVHQPSSFGALFAVEAGMFVILMLVLASVRLPSPQGDPEIGRALSRGSRENRSADGRWRALLRDRSMVLLCVLGFVLFFACYGQFESGLTAYAVEVTHISTSTLGIALAANTAVIVIAQYVVLRLVERRRRSRVIALVGTIWAVAWLAAGVSGLVQGAQSAATAFLITTYALFGLGETMLSPTVAPLVADLAPAPLVGQYNSAFALVKQVALSIGPSVGGLLAATGTYGTYIVMMVACSLGVAGLALGLGRHLTPALDMPYGSVLVAGQHPRQDADGKPDGTVPDIASGEKAYESF